MQQTFSPAPADGAGRSRMVPPSEAPVHSPIVVPPKKKQFKAPVASVDPDYLAGENVPDETPCLRAGDGARRAPEGKRGLFTLAKMSALAALRCRPRPYSWPRPCRPAPGQPAQVYRTSAAAYQEQVAAAPGQPAFAPPARRRAAAVALVLQRRAALGPRQRRHAVRTIARDFHLACGMPLNAIFAAVHVRAKKARLRIRDAVLCSAPHHAGSAPRHSITS
jgi:hypothetical protein